MDVPKVVELLTEMLHEQKETNARLDRVEIRLERLEKQQQTTNLKLQELTLSNLKMAEEFSPSMGNESCGSNRRSFINYFSAAASSAVSPHSRSCG